MARQQRIPQVRVNGKTKLGAFQEVVHKLIIKDRIQRAYARHAAEMMELKKFKREHGYCGGSPSCLEFTGDMRLCEACRKNEKNPKYKRPVYEYGKLRAKEREQERKDKDRESAPKRQKKAA